MTPSSYTEGAGSIIEPTTFMPTHRDGALQVVKYELYHLMEHMLLQPEYDFLALHHVRNLIDCIERS